MMMRHRYSTVYIVDAPAAVVSSQLFRANAMVEPHTTGPGGTTPQYFVQMANLYNHWVVLSSTLRYDVSITHTEGNGTGLAESPVMFGCYIEDDLTVSPTTVMSMMQQQTGTFTYATNATPATIKKGYSPKGSFGAPIQSNPRMSGQSTTNPLEQQFYLLWQFPNGPPSHDVVYQVSVTIEYQALWYELKNLG